MLTALLRIPLKVVRLLIRRPLIIRGSGPCGAHITRYTMYRELGGMFRDAPRSSRVLCISNSIGFAQILGLGDASLVGVDFPEHSILDLKSFADESFDFIISDQVLEHVEGDPALAFKESHRVLKPGGIAIHTTCFINPIHEIPVDLWRFTPYALRYLASDFSQILKCDGWGNRAVWIIDAIGMRTTPVPHATWHPLHKLATVNNPLWPVSTWIVAQK